MFTDWYGRWMYAWETRLTTRDENRVVRPLEWGFEWIVPFLEAHGFDDVVPGPEVERDAAVAAVGLAVGARLHRDVAVSVDVDPQ